MFQTLYLLIAMKILLPFFLKVTCITKKFYRIHYTSNVHWKIGSYWNLPILPISSLPMPINFYWKLPMHIEIIFVYITKCIEIIGIWEFYNSSGPKLFNSNKKSLEAFNAMNITSLHNLRPDCPIHQLLKVNVDNSVTQNLRKPLR
ncbi:hypothetical protein RhiirA5_422974 [Rhizophagus irregularis]|uniref:Uncharacterized protein n=1 Tax=Rhizophagus irregularis TaxID=588596 RepID=A0A2I1EZ26_9GLOM|nr:hypothetical protein RhiirA5_422974 [Rhizophagus irregularis]PKC60213.1 hypothetical protein RhiirA1_468361 [Rhizophagus irregularis]PKY27373.1 hypothetical protein RhiirB3_443051 [Rhizophagus irregularis]